MEIAGSRILVTGGSGRLGSEIARDLARCGADIAVGSHTDGARAAAVAAGIVASGRRAVVVVADLADAAAARGAVDAAADALGGLDAIVHAASGGFSRRGLAGIDEALVAHALGAAVVGTIFLAQRGRERLTAGGAIIVIGDVAGIDGWAGFLPHSAAKGAQRPLVRGLAKALAPDIRVALVHPGTVLEGTEQDPRTPITARTGRPQDICDAVRYLLGADFVTGTELIVDGGRSLR